MASLVCTVAWRVAIRFGLERRPGNPRGSTNLTDKRLIRVSMHTLQVYLHLTDLVDTQMDRPIG
ncbi:hypothetical protein BJY16_007363 [Actinoplanes octamycinicus]|uniref:Uncharacterized protein n=1 Tax=Actinoplanes octamycinicus TaxID=135948 RepID=A0A7W7H4Q4_9ACTN|nr:hypothetical protein [Actinoplanes octamycinicus]MBB4743904.1 hypothetical protein [Actinoplanes octamycinicus]GIE58531.1 hypothetical protein Aoc01nite_39330 [Actinoplanes octamycinicus]